MAVATGFETALLNRVDLQELVEVVLIAPPAIEVVELRLAAGGVADDGINPVGQLHRQPLNFTTEELRLALHGLGQPQPLAGGPDGGSVFDLSAAARD